jgi:hypothetical protein
MECDSFAAGQILWKLRFNRRSRTYNRIVTTDVIVYNNYDVREAQQQS